MNPSDREAPVRGKTHCSLQSRHGERTKEFLTLTFWAELSGMVVHGESAVGLSAKPPGFLSVFSTVLSLVHTISSLYFLCFRLVCLIDRTFLFLLSYGHYSSVHRLLINKMVRWNRNVWNTSSEAFRVLHPTSVFSPKQRWSPAVKAGLFD